MTLCLQKARKINTFRRENENTFPIPIMFSNKSIFQIAVKLIIVVALFFSTNGCLLNRLVKTRQDLCAGDICYNTESRTIKFDKPRLGLKDIESIIGEPPSSKCDEIDSICVKYIANRVKYPDASQCDLITTFILGKDKGDIKLNEIRFSKNIVETIPSRLADTFMNSSYRCSSKIDYTKRTALVNFPVEDDKFPIPSMLEEIFGKADHLNGSKYTFNYISKNGSHARFEVEYEANNNPKHLHIDYLGYQLKIDFKKGEAFARIEDIARFFNGFSL
jgi:hypothetical protein